MNAKVRGNGQSQARSNKSNASIVSKDQLPEPAAPRPSASVMIISPTNQVLLLQRVQDTTSFASAHVFPGGNVSPYHDGNSLPDLTSEACHEDRLEYRLAAIREAFEESGLLLARDNNSGNLLKLRPSELEEGRRKIHANKIPFKEWLAEKGGHADVDALVPFTRWISPTHVRRRFTTQMYVYFLPMLPDRDFESPMPLSGDASGLGASAQQKTILTPTTDGGIEHTSATFLPASVWCTLAQEGEIMLIPPQFFLLHCVSRFLDALEADGQYKSMSRQVVGREEIESRRRNLLTFIHRNEGGQDAIWAEKCVSPMRVMPSRGKPRTDGREVMELHHPGHELRNSNRSGIRGFCMLYVLEKEGPRRLCVVSRGESGNKL